MAQSYPLYVLYILLCRLAIVTAQAQNFLLNFESARFQGPTGTGPITEPVLEFDVSAFRVLEGDDIQGNSVTIGELKFGLLKQCSPTHYITRIAPKTQDRIGGQSIIKIAKDDRNLPLFRSFDLTEICMGCAFIPAATQGTAIGGTLTNRDTLSRFIVPATCKIKVTGKKVGENQREFSEVVDYTANAPLDLADPRKFYTSDMTRFQFDSTWTKLEYIKIEIQGRPQIGLPVELPQLIGGITQVAGPFYSVALDNIGGRKNAT